MNALHLCGNASTLCFFNRYRELYPVSKLVLKDIARQYDQEVGLRIAA